MKRLWLAVGIFTAIIVLCVTTLIYQRRQINRLLDNLDTVIAVFDSGDDERAYDLAVTLEVHFSSRTRFFPLFMAHGDLVECRESFALLPSILMDGDVEEFHMESTRCRIQLERLSKSELPTLENIL